MLSENKAHAMVEQEVRRPCNIQAAKGSMDHPDHGHRWNHTLLYICARDVAIEEIEMENQSHRRIGGKITAPAIELA